MKVDQGTLFELILVSFRAAWGSKSLILEVTCRPRLTLIALLATKSLGCTYLEAESLVCKVAHSTLSTSYLADTLEFSARADAGSQLP